MCLPASFDLVHPEQQQPGHDGEHADPDEELDVEEGDPDELVNTLRMQQVDGSCTVKYLRNDSD